MGSRPESSSLHSETFETPFKISPSITTATRPNDHAKIFEEIDRINAKYGPIHGRPGTLRKAAERIRDLVAKTRQPK